MENPRPSEEKVINIFRLEKLKEETINTTIKDIRILLFRLQGENEEITYRILRDIRNVFRLEK